MFHKSIKKSKKRKAKSGKLVRRTFRVVHFRKMSLNIPAFARIELKSDANAPSIPEDNFKLET